MKEKIKKNEEETNIDYDDDDNLSDGLVLLFRISAPNIDCSFCVCVCICLFVCLITLVFCMNAKSSHSHILTDYLVQTG